MSKSNRRNRNRNNQQPETEEVNPMSEDVKEFSGPEVVKKGTPEVKDTPVATPEPVKQPEVKAQPTPTKPTTVTTTVKTDNLTNVERMLMDYVSKRQSDISEEELGKVQLGLIRLIRTVLGRQDNEQFRREWNALLTMARKNKDTVFNVNDLFVGIPSIPGSEQEIAIFRHVGWVILRSLNPNKIKEEMKSIDTSRILVNLNAIESRNFVSYYD